MFQDRYHSMMCSNRQLQKNLKHLQSTLIQNPEDYQEVNILILESCDEIELKKQTKYLAKKSFDAFVLKFPQVNSQFMLLAAYTFISMSVKFIEDPEAQSKITLKWFFHKLDAECKPFEIEQFISLEAQIFQMAEFDLNFTTPYDYLGLHKQAFSTDQKMVQRIENALDISLSIPELMFASAEELFFGAMVMIADEVNYEKEWILRQTFYREESIKVGQIIKQDFQGQLEAIMREGAQN